MRSRQHAGDVGFRLEVIYEDPDLLELQVSAWNGRFGGATDVYVGNGELEQAAAILAGFPRSPSDVRTVVLGSFGRVLAGGAAKLRLYCSDRAGHAYLESNIESDVESAGVLQVARIVMPIEPAAVDRFVEDLRQVDKDRCGSAQLYAGG